MIKVFLVGGGTAGHIYPLLAVAEELARVSRHTELLFIGPGSYLEQRLLVERGINFCQVPAGKIRRYFSWWNFVDPFKTGAGIVKALQIFHHEKPDVLFSKGGYAAYPAVLAAKWQKVPVVVHESDIVVGAVNRKSFAWAKKFLVGFPVQYYPKEIQEKAEFVGIPVRQEFQPVTPRQKKQLLKKYGLLENRPVILVFGGSQGALKINQLIWKILPHLLEKNQLIHLTGESWIKEAQKIKHGLASAHKLAYHPRGYAEELPELVAMADVVVSRAGATTLAELAMSEKPAIVIPLPSAAGDHQRKNAQFYAVREAVEMLEEERLSAFDLLDKIKQILFSQTKREKLTKNIAKLKVKDSARRIAQAIVNAKEK